MTLFSLGPCRKRLNTLPWMDSPDISDEGLLKIYQFIENNDRLTGTSPEILRLLNRWSKLWGPEKYITLLLLNCGTGRLAADIHRWAKKNKKEVRILAVDRYGRTIHLAKEINPPHSDLEYDVRDWSDALFLQARQFDYVIAHSTLYHLELEEVPDYFKTIDRLAKRGLIIGDWTRDLRAWVWMKAASKLQSDEAVTHDAPHIIQRSLTEDEIMNYLNQTGLDYLSYKKLLGFKFLAYGEKPLALGVKSIPLTGWAGA